MGSMSSTSQIRQVDIYPETNSSHLPGCAIPKGNDRLPTILFLGAMFVSFRDGTPFCFTCGFLQGCCNETDPFVSTSRFGGLCNGNETDAICQQVGFAAKMLPFAKFVSEFCWFCSDNSQVQYFFWHVRKHISLSIDFMQDRCGYAVDVFGPVCAPVSMVQAMPRWDIDIYIHNIYIYIHMIYNLTW